MITKGPELGASRLLQLPAELRCTIWRLAASDVFAVLISDDGNVSAEHVMWRVSRSIRKDILAIICNRQDLIVWCFTSPKALKLTTARIQDADGLAFPLPSVPVKRLINVDVRLLRGLKTGLPPGTANIMTSHTRASRALIIKRHLRGWRMAFKDLAAGSVPEQLYLDVWWCEHARGSILVDQIDLMCKEVSKKNPGAQVSMKGYASEEQQVSIESTLSSRRRNTAYVAHWTSSV